VANVIAILCVGNWQFRLIIMLAGCGNKLSLSKRINDRLLMLLLVDAINH